MRWRARLSGHIWDLGALLGLGEETGHAYVRRDEGGEFWLEWPSEHQDALDAYLEGWERLRALNETAARHAPSFRPVHLHHQLVSERGFGQLW